MGSFSSSNSISSSSFKGGTVDEPSLELTLILAFSPILDALTGMPEVCISFETDLNIRNSNGVETVDVLGIVESVMIGEERGMEI